jgi:hypothetical protein
MEFGSRLVLKTSDLSDSDGSQVTLFLDNVGIYSAFIQHAGVWSGEPMVMVTSDARPSSRDFPSRLWGRLLFPSLELKGGVMRVGEAASALRLMKSYHAHI